MGPKIGGHDPLLDSAIAVSVVGPGFGESVLINVGGRILGLVDCCHEVVGRRSRRQGLLEKSMRASPKARLRFGLLTHPHLDHFSGFDKILDRYSDDLAWMALFNSTTAGELRCLLSRSRRASGYEPAKEQFHGKFKKILEKYEQRLTESQQINAGDRTLLADEELIAPDGSKIPFRIECYAPSAMASRKFMNQAKLGDLIGMGTGSKVKQSQRCNMVSVVCRVCFGKARILLAADAEAATWRSVLRSHKGKLRCHLLKVGHHGSSNGTSRELLREISKGPSRRVAVVTPASRYGLPSPDVIRSLESTFSVVLRTDEGELPYTPDAAARSAFPEMRDVKGVGKSTSGCVATVVLTADGNYYEGSPEWCAYPQSVQWSC